MCTFLICFTIVYCVHEHVVLNDISKDESIIKHVLFVVFKKFIVCTLSVQELQYWNYNWGLMIQSFLRIGPFINIRIWIEYSELNPALSILANTNTLYCSAKIALNSQDIRSVDINQIEGKLYELSNSHCVGIIWNFLCFLFVFILWVWMYKGKD